MGFCVALAGTADSNKDYEYRVQTWRETMIDLAAIRLLLNRISPHEFSNILLGSPRLK